MPSISLKELIFEAAAFKIIEFDLEEFKKLPDFASKENYLDELLKLESITELGRGISRIAYDIGNNKVLKFCQREGTAWSWQNETEIRIWRCSNNSPVLARIFEWEQNNPLGPSWIIAEKANMIFEEILDGDTACLEYINNALNLKHSKITDWYTLQDLFAILSLAVDNKVIKFNSAPVEYAFNEIFPDNITAWTKEFISLEKVCKFKAKDLHCGNWGLFGMQLKLVDYGIAG